MDKIEVRDDNNEPVMKIIDGKVYRLIDGNWVEEVFPKRKLIKPVKNQKDKDEENGTRDSSRSNDET